MVFIFGQNSDQIGNSITELTLVDIVWCLETIMMDLWLSIWCSFFFLFFPSLISLELVKEWVTIRKLKWFTLAYLSHILKADIKGNMKIRVHFRPKLSHFDHCIHFAASIIWWKYARFGKKWPSVCNSSFINSRSIYFGPFSTFQFGRCI